MSTAEAKKTGGYLKDKVLIAKTRVMSDEVQRAILKTTSHKMKPPNKKHMDRLVAASYGHYENVNLSELVNDMEKRLHCYESIVVLKALVTLHTLLKSGSLDMGMSIAKHSGLFHVSQLKEGEGIEYQFIKLYSRYMEERCMAVLQSGCTQKLEKTKQLVAELDTLTVMQALQATKAYTLQLQVLAEANLTRAPMWAENPCIMAGFKLIIQDSIMLYVLLSKRCLWLLDRAASLSPEEREIALETYMLFMDSSTKLLALFKKLKAQKGFIAKEIPNLTPLSDSTIDRIKSYLQDGMSPGAATVVASDVDEIATAPLVLPEEVHHEDLYSPGLNGTMNTVVRDSEAASAAGPPSPHSPEPQGVQLFASNQSEQDLFQTRSSQPDQDLFETNHQQLLTSQPVEQLFQQQPVQEQQLFPQQPAAQQQQPFAHSQQPLAQQRQQQQPFAHSQQPMQQTTTIDDIWNAPAQTDPAAPAKPVTLDDLFT
eukprot:TRINITY_DN16744_c0_g1_i1.p1 TRINITY_DN16744_c0_g1~~TRINITY_DN16744_c0_g1_i1.p1  ORF type:complete len:483 (+),score=122.97 TRINITY_DN16744_c0_g1_i1:49-1497(+)